MPIYEYRCDNCGHEFETIQKVSEDPLKTCPACETDALRKKVSRAAFRLKGAGWYETDFKSDKKRNVAGEDKSGGGKESGEGAGSTEKASDSAKSGDGANSKSAGEGGKSSSEGKGTGSTSKSKAAE